MEEGENGKEFSAANLFITGVRVEKIETLVFRSIGQCDYSGETTMQRFIGNSIAWLKWSLEHATRLGTNSIRYRLIRDYEAGKVFTNLAY